jgi:uncharacterized membrane protein affecting hemolysin expression
MNRRYWWLLIAVLIGAILAGSLLAVQYAKQQVPERSDEKSDGAYGRGK